MLVKNNSILLEPFAADNTSIPINGLDKVFTTSQKEKQIQFLIYIQSCLPITQDTSLLETSLSEAQYLINEERVKSGIMRASGVLSDQGYMATGSQSRSILRQDEGNQSSLQNTLGVVPNQEIPPSPMTLQSISVDKAVDSKRVPEKKDNS